MRLIDLDKWQEIFESIRKHPVRTLLTALGVFWGIFMLVLLLGAGNGLHNGIDYEFRDDATNSIFIRRGTTSIPHNGLPAGRRVRFYNDDFTYLTEQFEDIEYITGRFYLSGDRVVQFGDKSLSFPIRAVHPDHKFLENTIMLDGRYINQEDVDGVRKVCVIGKTVRENLFGDVDPIGQEIQINDAVYKVVGLYRDTGGENEMKIIYLPVSTAQKRAGNSRELHQINLTTGDLPLDAMQQLEKKIRVALAARHQFSEDDNKALYTFNLAEEYQKISGLLFAIKAFVWFVGIGSIVSGVIGVSNIMLIVVKDRTKEIGIRKALGATPRSIVSMILQESIFITALAGYFGLLAAVILLSVMGSIEVDYFRNPKVQFGVGLIATCILVIAGALAGLMPALKAARINPVVAMRDI